MFLLLFDSLISTVYPMFSNWSPQAVSCVKFQEIVNLVFILRNVHGEKCTCKTNILNQTKIIFSWDLEVKMKVNCFKKHWVNEGVLGVLRHKKLENPCFIQPVMASTGMFVHLPVSLSLDKITPNVTK